MIMVLESHNPLGLVKFIGELKANEIINSCVNTIVGIDLTGSELKPSGWAVFENGLMETKRLRTDKELIDYTIRKNPIVISIDAPLTLPLGRISVFDSDPGRKQFGITRLCERLLLKRGIRSYPPLIKSMQKLTLRGITLASQFKQLGYNVIETFPGGCQDILGLTRKQKGLPELLNGLGVLGVNGEFHEKKITHDEADAITAALAGIFYIHDQYESFGNPDEGLIILPKIKKSL